MPTMRQARQAECLATVISESHRWLRELGQSNTAAHVHKHQTSSSSSMSISPSSAASLRSVIPSSSSPSASSPSPARSSPSPNNMMLLHQASSSSSASPSPPPPPAARRFFIQQEDLAAEKDATTYNKTRLATISSLALSVLDSEENRQSNSDGNDDNINLLSSSSSSEKQRWEQQVLPMLVALSKLMKCLASRWEFVPSGGQVLAECGGLELSETVIQTVLNLDSVFVTISPSKSQRSRVASALSLASKWISVAATLASNCWAAMKVYIVEQTKLLSLIEHLFNRLHLISNVMAMGSPNVERAARACRIQACRFLGNVCFGTDKFGAMQMKALLLFGQTSTATTSTKNAIPLRTTSVVLSHIFRILQLPPEHFESDSRFLLSAFDLVSLRWAVHAISSISYGGAPNPAQDVLLGSFSAPSVVLRMIHAVTGAEFLTPSATHFSKNNKSATANRRVAAYRHNKRDRSPRSGRSSPRINDDDDDDDDDDTGNADDDDDDDEADEADVDQLHPFLQGRLAIFLYHAMEALANLCFRNEKAQQAVFDEERKIMKTCGSIHEDGEKKTSSSKISDQHKKVGASLLIHPQKTLSRCFDFCAHNQEARGTPHLFDLFCFLLCALTSKNEKTTSSREEEKEALRQLVVKYVWLDGYVSAAQIDSWRAALHFAEPPSPSLARQYNEHQQQHPSSHRRYSQWRCKVSGATDDLI